MASAMTRQVARMRLMDATLIAGVKIENVSQWCRLNGVDRRTFYRHRQRIGAEGGWAPRSRRARSSPAAAPAPGAGLAGAAPFHREQDPQTGRAGEGAAAKTPEVIVAAVRLCPAPGLLPDRR